MPTHVFSTMGTMASIRTRLVAPGPATLASLEDSFARWESRFSLYDDGSELSHVALGQLSLLDASDTLRTTFALSNEWRLLTGGAFTAERPDGTLDLSGIVKALAIAEAGEILATEVADDWLITVGGDCLASVEPQGAPWQAGIVDPANRGRLLCVVPLGPSWRAIATSGTSEGGEHVWRSRVANYHQVSVLANDIETADVLATAILSGGSALRDEALAGWDIDVLTVDEMGGLEMSGRLRDSVRSLPILRT